MDLSEAILEGDVGGVRALIESGVPSVRSQGSQRSYLDLAIAKGVPGSVVVLLKANPPGADKFAGHRQLQHDYIAWTSYSYTLANWYDNIEFIIWSLVVRDAERYDFSEFSDPLRLSSQERSEWAFLCDAAGGWFIDDGFVAKEEWGHRYNSFRHSI